MSKSIAIITARGGSKRIPKKNIKDFCGKPIIIYSIQAALDSGMFDEVMVSTDSREIADVAMKAGAKVPFMRSESASNDYATTADVLKEVLGCYAQQGIHYDYGCCIYPTAPFVTGEELKKAIHILQNNELIHTVIPLVAFSFPPQRGMILTDNMAKLQYPAMRDKRSQDLEKIYHDCGQYYVFRVNEFLKKGVLLGDAVAPIIKDELEVQDIDNETDWKLAEMKYQILRG